MPAEGAEMHAPQSELASRAADILARVRQDGPRVHCITNPVAQAFTANLLLAAGALPSMTLATEEIAAFTAGADALLVNLGTFDRERREAAETALAVAAEKAIPWVLDPVLIDRSAPRATYAQSLLARRPAAIRLNRAELAALGGGQPEGEGLARFAQDHRTVLGLTGAVDQVTDGS